LRQTIFQLKKLGIVVRADRDNLQLSQHDARSDIDALSANDPRMPNGSESMEFLPGYIPRDSEPLRDWVDAKKNEVHALVTRALVRDLERARLQGDWTSVDRISSQCLSLDSFNEVAVLAQAEASAMRGGKRKALSILDRYIAEVGDGQSDLRLPATLLRRRVAERVPDRQALLNVDPPFVGREAEMEALTRSFSRARTGHGSATLLIGEPGIGKSRLTAELGRFAELQGASVQRATCTRTDLDRPLSLFVDIVPQLRDMPGALGCESETFVWLKRLTEFEQRAVESSRPVDSEIPFQNVRTALFDLLDSVAEERCLVILVEDVQWLDDASAKLLARIIEWCETKHLFLLLNSRPAADSFLRYTEKARLEQITLSPLTVAASTTLLQSIALRPGDEPEREFVDWCLTVAEGNPFFLQELVHQWIETGHRYEAPPSVTKVLQERLSRLSREALQVLQTSAVLGDFATLDRVEKVLEYHPHQLLSAVEELSTAAMLALHSESTEVAAGQLQPRHDLLSSGALRRLAAVSLAFVHRRSADVLEGELSPDAMSTTMLWACANHRHQAGDRERALSLSTSCAEHLQELGLAHDACTAFERSLGYCGTDFERLKLLPRLASALELDGEWTRSMDVLRTCMRLAAKDDPSKSQHNNYELLLHDARHRSALDFVTLLQDTMPCVESEQALPGHRVGAAVLALKLAVDLGRSEYFDTIHRQISPLLDEGDVNECNRLEFQMIYQTMRGDDLVPVEDLWRFAEVARLTEGEVGYSRAIVTAATACRLSARYSQGMEILARAFDHAIANRLYSKLPTILMVIAELNVAAGDFDKAYDAVKRIERHPIPSSNIRDRNQIHYLEARIALERGDLAGATNAFALIDTVTPTYSVSRRGYYLALEVRISLQQNVTAERLSRLVAELESTHLQMRDIGLQDFESYSLYLGLSALGKKHRGKQLLREYVEARHIKWPLPEPVLCALNIGNC
jgi:tetratricopeptide (TPR) repeat protein